MPLARPEALPERIGRAATIARFKPLHLGHAAVLDALAARADALTLGIGSSNVYDARNPFTARESAVMIRIAIGERHVIEVPDLNDGPRWRAMVVQMLGPLDLFVTANAYVRDLLIDDYLIAHPVWLIAPSRRVRIDATMVRREMAHGREWKKLVPDAIAQWLEREGLVERFLSEFGAETRAADAG